MAKNIPPRTGATIGNTSTPLEKLNLLILGYTKFSTRVKDIPYT
jgi:hypothetical protein